jgi:hypothetical protein
MHNIFDPPLCLLLPDICSSRVLGMLRQACCKPIGIRITSSSSAFALYIERFAYYCGFYFAPFRPSNSDFAYIEEGEVTHLPPVWDILHSHLTQATGFVLEGHIYMTASLQKTSENNCTDEPNIHPHILPLH